MFYNFSTLLMNKKIINIRLLIFALFSMFFFKIHAQSVPSKQPFQGFHIGLTGQTEFVQKCSFIALSGSDPIPRARWTTGCETGLEFSYHFGKYFGIVAGINYGTVLSFKNDIYMSTVPDGAGGWEVWNEYETALSTVSENGIIIPLKLEFHFPMYRNIFFMAETGIKIKGLLERLAYRDGGMGLYSTTVDFSYYPTSGNQIENISYYSDFGERNMGEISCDLLLGLGLYYKLPYSDLLRFSAGVNISFNNIIEGYYNYHLTNSYGTFAIKNDFFYTQLSYIHTLNYKKAKKYLKAQGITYSTKNDRRKAIINLLNN